MLLCFDVRSGSAWKQIILLKSTDLYQILEMYHCHHGKSFENFQSGSRSAFTNSQRVHGETAKMLKDVV